MNRPLTLMLAVLLFPLAASAGTANLVSQLDEKERRLEQLYADYWREQYKVALGDEEASSLPIQAKMRELLTNAEFMEQLREAQFEDPVLQRRRKLFLEEATHTLIFTEPELAASVEAMERDEAAIRYQVGERRLTRSELNNLLAHEPDRDLRRLAWLARAQNDAVTGKRIAAAIRLREEMAQRDAGRSFVDFTLDRKGVPDRTRLLAMFRQIREETESEYQSLLGRMRQELGVEKVEPWDIDFFFTRITGEVDQEALEPEEMWSKVKRLTADLGLDLEPLPVDMKIAEITFGGGTYPILYGKEVRILVNKYTGIRFLDTLLHEVGHALHYSFNADPTFILRSGFSEPFDEGLGQVMSLMLYRPPMATKYFGLTQRQAESLRERYRLKTMVDIRETMADSLFELAAYDNPDQDLPTLYNRIYSEYLGVDMHGAPVWAFDPFYSSGPVYLQSYVVAEMVGRQVHHDLEKRFGKGAWDKEAGEYLRKNYFSAGGRWTLDEILERSTGKPLTPQYLIESWNGKH